MQIQVSHSITVVGKSLAWLSTDGHSCFCKSLFLPLLTSRSDVKLLTAHGATKDCISRVDHLLHVIKSIELFFVSIILF